MKEQLLRDLAEAIAASGDGRKLFINWQHLLGFRIGWANEQLARELCVKYDLNPNECEIIMMQATGLTECHMHQRGSTVFMALGKQHGFADTRGGTLFGDFKEGQEEFQLVPEHAQAGETFEVSAGKIHAFFAEPGGELTLIGLVMPRIKQGNEFDVVPFKYVSDRNVRLGCWF